MNKQPSLIGGVLLVAGTTIGGGMLALPVLTSLGGFLPSLVIYFLCWAFMTSTGLLFLEISCWLKKDANILSMAEYTLGPWGRVAAWGLYLFQFYCLTLAYIVGCGNLIYQLFGGTLPDWSGGIIVVLLFAPFVFAGPRVVGGLNIWLMLGLGLCYVTFVFFGYTHVNTDLLQRAEWPLSLLALPVAFTAFAYQGIIPTLVTYLQNDMRRLRMAIIGGSLIPLVAYIIWQWLILGIIPTEGPGGLAEALKQGNNAVYPLKNFLNAPWIVITAQFFAFFALVTSLLGVTLGLLDFLADGLKISKDAKGRFWLCLVIFLPPLIIATTHPHVFLTALDYAGGFGCALLLGLLPVLMVWSGRYYMGLKGTHQIRGGRLVLSLLIAFVIIELACEIVLIINKV